MTTNRVKDLPNTNPAFHHILKALAETPSETLAAQWPHLQPHEIKAALAFAASLTKEAVPPPALASTATELNLNKVMVVDDIPDNLLLMEHLFRKSNFSLITVSDPRQALHLAKTERPALIVSDVQMPHLTGFQLLTHLKTDPVTRDIAVIFVTAHHRSSDQASQGLILGADDYIQRPFMRDEFLSRVEAVIRTKRTEIEARRQARGVAQRNLRLQWVNELAVAVNSGLELPQIFASSMQKLAKLLRVAAVAVVLRIQEAPELLVTVSTSQGETPSARVELPPEELADQSPDAWTSAFVSAILWQHSAELSTGLSDSYEAIQTVPMFSKEQLVGTIALIDLPGRTIEEADLVMVNSAAGIIAVAVENAHLLEQAQEQVDDLIAMTEIGRALTSNLDLEQTLKQTTLFVQRALQCEAVSLWLLDETGQELTLTTASGVGADMVVGFKMSASQGVVGHVVKSGEHYISADLSQDEFHFRHSPDSREYRPGSILSIPVQAKGQIIGAMQALHRKKRWFNAEHLRLAYPVANFVGIAVENARLFREVQEFNRHLEQMVAERTQEVAEEKEKTEAILASMADGLVVLDAEKRILTANKAAETMLSFSLAALRGRPIALERLQEPLWRSLNDIASSDEPTTTDLFDIRLTGGTILSLQTRSAKVINEHGQLLGTVVVLRDITALKEVERMKARFMAGVTHELKTPLAIIRLHSKNLSNYHDRLLPAKRQELLTSIQGQAELLATLIEDILEISRFDAVVSKSERTVLDLEPLISRIVGDLRPLADSNRIKLFWRPPSQPINTVADPSQMERLVRNLIDNAIKYTPPGGSVTVETYLGQSNGSGTVGIQVTDTGIGIPAEHLPQIFDRFHRVDPSHTTPGTGLGLSIVQEIVNAHYGEIQVESQVGRGSQFRVTLPGHVA
ncbi:MAG TPA: ATP-binding protein [Anaerolineae bacterium]|nr:ATP-binding protein [Anaerolineae bacterium]